DGFTCEQPSGDASACRPAHPIDPAFSSPSEIGLAPGLDERTLPRSLHRHLFPELRLEQLCNRLGADPRLFRPLERLVERKLLRELLEELDGLVGKRKDDGAVLSPPLLLLAELRHHLRQEVVLLALPPQLIPEVSVLSDQLLSVRHV